MNIFETLTEIKNSKLKINPFINYDPSIKSESESLFHSNEQFWMIEKVEYSSQGNLNLRFKIDGYIEFEDQKIKCSTYKRITIVKNGQLKQCYLFVEHNKEIQEKLNKLGIKIENHIINLKECNLTDTVKITKDMINETVVYNLIKQIKIVNVRNKTELNEYEQKLASIGLKNGIYTVPVLNKLVVEKQNEIKIKLDGLSTKTTKLAKRIKELDVIVKNVDQNKLLYDLRCLGIKDNMNIEYKLSDDITITGTLTI